MTKYVGYITDTNYDESNRYQAYGAKCPYLRRVFVLKKTVKKATLKGAAYGIFRAFVNSSLVSEELFPAGWSDTHYTVYYRSYDITALVKQGKNALGVTLGDGWYASHLSDVGKFVFGGYPLKFHYEIDIVYEDGTSDRFTPDGSEKASVGAYIASDNQNGMIIDEREDCGDFSSPDFDDGAWDLASLYDGLKPRKANFEPIMPHSPLHPTVYAMNGNKTVYDFGQNFAGILKARFKGKRGDTITFRYGELPDGDGVYTENLRSAKATDTFILSGEGSGEFYPVFTYHGFRYAEIVVSEGVETLSVEGIPLYSDLKETSSFSCSNEIVTKLYQNILWGQRSNFFSIPTDCPQRDERLGWTGDAQLFCDMAAYNMDISKFYAKFLDDAEDAMKDGKADLPVVLPYLFDYVPYDKLHIGYPGWSDAVIFIAYRLYLVYGNKSVLLEHLPIMKKHIEYMLTLCDGLIPTRCLCHGDWLSVYETTDKRVYSTLYLAHAANILSKICRIVGDRDEGYYIDLFLRVKRAFKEAFVDEDGKIESDTQCCYILALAFGVLSDDDVREHLRRKFLQYGNKLTAGFHGAKYALEALCKAGLQDIAYTVITNTEYPSWGYSIENGATTIWERWDGYKKDGMHKDPMNSFNHFVFGSAGYWLFEGMLGITPEEDGAGFKKITVRPYLDKRIATGQGSYDSPNGLISVSFAYGDGGFDYTIALPKAMQVKFAFVQEVESIVEETDGKTKTYRVRLKERV